MKKKVKIWILPILTSAILAVFVIGFALLYHEVQKRLQSKETSIMAKAVAMNLASEIKNVTRLLDELSHIEIDHGDENTDNYNRVAKSLLDRYPGVFYAVNYVNPKGFIEKVYPIKENQLALGRNVLNRTGFKETNYVTQARDNKITTMSPRVLTYQGIYACIIYRPLFNHKQEFKGWITALIHIDEWLKEQLKVEGWLDAHIRLHWKSGDGIDLEIGKKSFGVVYPYDFKVMNQDVRLDVGISQNSLQTLHNKIIFTINLIGFFMLLLVSYLLFKLTTSRFKLIYANQQLNLKNILLNSLAHDISSPLTSLGLMIEHIALKKDAHLTEAQKLRAVKSLAIISKMLASVRSLSRLEIERQELQTQSVSLPKAIEESMSRVQEQAAQKRVAIKTEAFPKNIFVRADESTLVNNVIPNVLNNAIKFTKADSIVTLTLEVEKDFIWLKVADEGSGLTEVEIENFNRGYGVKSTPGTEGEVGSGLGLTQVKGFMELYGGRAFLENSNKGALVKLKFKRDH